MMSASWTASDRRAYRGATTATLRTLGSDDEAGPKVAAVLRFVGEYCSDEVRLTVEELRELATIATALADAKVASDG